MAILDDALTFSDAQAITVTAVSSDVIDFDVERDMGIGAPVYFAVQVGTAFAGLTSLTVVLQSSDDASTWIELYTSAAFDSDDLVAGAQPVRVVVPSPTGRYLRVHYAVDGTATAGTVTASVLLGPDGYLAYPPGVAGPDFSAVTESS